MNSRYWGKTKKFHQNYLLSKERMLAGYYVVTQAMRGKGLKACWHVRQVSTGDTLARGHVNTQGTLACEHLSTHCTWAPKHPNNTFYTSCT